MAITEIAEALKGAGPVATPGLIGVAVGTSYDAWTNEVQIVVSYTGIVLIVMSAVWALGAMIGALIRWVKSPS